MKKLALVLAIVTVLITLCSCGQTEKDPVEDVTNEVIVDPQSGAYIEVGSGLKTMYLAKDVHGNICTHVLYNTLTNEYWIYDFEYIYDWNTEGYVFNRAYLTIKECLTTEKNPSGNQTVIVSPDSDSEDTGTIVNPDKETSTQNPTFNEVNPSGTVWAHENYVKVTQGDIKEDWMGKYIEVTIENQNTFSVMVSVRDTSVNDVMYNLWCSESVAAGKKAIVKFRLPDADNLAEIHETKLNKIDFTLVAYNNDTYTGVNLIEEEVNLTFNGLR